jgi:hypothetical protein
VTPPTPGPNTITVREEDYRYGGGPLTLRLECIDQGRPLRIDGDDWYLVRGVQIGWNGADLDRREVLIRARSLPAPIADVDAALDASATTA